MYFCTAHINTQKSGFSVRSEAEDLQHTWLVLEQWILLPVSSEERGFCVAEKNTQAFAFDHVPGAVSYWLVRLVFFVQQDGNHGDKHGQAANGDQDTIHCSQRGVWVSARDRDQGAGESQACIVSQSEIHTVRARPIEGSSHRQEAQLVHSHGAADPVLGDLAGGVRDDRTGFRGSGPFAGHSEVHQ